jgi:hypothetical protein
MLETYIWCCLALQAQHLGEVLETRENRKKGFFRRRQTSDGRLVHRRSV